MRTAVKTRAEKGKQKLYCNVLAQEKGVDPVGHAGYFEDAILVEAPLPWKRDVFAQPGVLPKESKLLRDLWLKEYQETGRYPHLPLLLAPDDNYSVPGLRRVIFYERPLPPFATFNKLEYLVPEEQLGPLVWALHQDKPTLANFERYRLPQAESIRDILVCTHGSVDVVCAKFGFPIFKHLQEKYGDEQLRIWRVTHFGGHVFAPTLIDMPIGHYWAYVEEPQAAQIIERQTDVSHLRGHYRGWAGLEGGFAQAAEREMWQREGWEWFAYDKQVEILDQGWDEEQPAWAAVRMTFSGKDDVRTQYEAVVELVSSIATFHSTDSEIPYSYPQYVVRSLHKI